MIQSIAFMALGNMFTGYHSSRSQVNSYMTKRKSLYSRYYWYNIITAHANARLWQAVLFWMRHLVSFIYLYFTKSMVVVEQNR